MNCRRSAGEIRATVFDLLILGLTNSEIAQRLELSVRTVESHRANLQEKLGLGTRSQLVELSLKCGPLSRPIASDRQGLPSAAKHAPKSYVAVG